MVEYGHVMVDLETLALGPDAAFVSLGACEFNKAGQIGRKFYKRIDWASAIKKERKVDVSTIKWWMGQNEKARKEVTSPGESLDEVMVDFSLWFPRKSKVWSNGATFDIVILENYYGPGSAPWDFWDTRDMRTVLELGSGVVSQEQIRPFEGVEHHALDDAINQAKKVATIWGLLHNNQKRRTTP